MKVSTHFLLRIFCFCAAAAFVAPAAADEPQGNWVLLIDAPKRYAEPSADAAARVTDWEAGLRLTMLQHDPASQVSTTDTLTGWFRVRPRADETATAGWVPAAFVAPPPGGGGMLEAIGEEVVDRWHGLPPDYTPDDLVSVGPRYEDEIDYRMRREAAGALKSMIAAANADGIALYVVSAYRSWRRQQINYQNRVERSGWDQNTVARPGHSEHQLGTAVDLTDGDKATLLEESFGATRAGIWLRENAPRFGFAQSYTPRNRAATGYAAEPWHYRYWGVDKASAKHAAAWGSRD
jgi:D-alanyl-D-alanine carboxypeptidase